MRFGVSLFALNPTLMNDPETVLARLQAAGYRYLEPCIAVEPIPRIESHLWRFEDLEGRKPLYTRYGFTVDSCHVFTKNLLSDLGVIIPPLKAAGLTKLILPCPRYESTEQYTATAEMLRASAKILAENGIELLLHNGDDVSTTVVEGMSAFEWLLKACGPTVGCQADLGWLAYAGIDCEAFLWRNSAQVRSLHYKDMKPTENGLKETAIGTGIVDMTACFQFARAQELIQLADQDGSEGDIVADLEACGAKLARLSSVRDNSISELCLMDTVTGAIRSLYTYEGVIEAPNWSQHDPDKLYFNCEGTIRRYSISEGTAVQIESGHCTNCNNDHVLSADGTEIAVSHSETGWMSQVYILPIEGGEPRLITPNAPSYLHGWSPDGKELAYCAFRDHGKGREVDVYTISAEGGEETQLTHDAGFNDGPEYSPDGKHIWFISTRTGLMQCWRMNRDGSEQTQMTFSEKNNWFPHVSPDGKKVVYLSYSKYGLDAAQHLPNMQVELSLMNYDGSDDHRLLSFFGGQGSINVNSWSPDNRHIAFVRYELKHK